MSKLLVFATLVFAGVLLTTLVFVNVNTSSLRKTRHGQAGAQGHHGLHTAWQYNWENALPKPQFGEQVEISDFSYVHENEHAVEVQEAHEACELESFTYNYVNCCKSFCNTHFLADVARNLRFAGNPAPSLNPALHDIPVVVDQDAKSAALNAFLDGRQTKLAACFAKCAPAAAANASSGNSTRF